MKPIGEFIKSTLIGGLLVILPLGLIATLVIKVVGILKPLVDPIVPWLPGWFRFPIVITSVLLVLFCFVAGLLARTPVGQGAGRFFDRAVFNHIPGYSLMRSLTRRIGNVADSKKFAPAFVQLEGALVPAFVVEELANGKCTVFVPSAPMPGVGTIYIITKERVHLLDITFLKTVQCISSWGVGSAELLQAMRAPEGTQQ